MSQYSDWFANEAKDLADKTFWHAYRARQVDGKWDYDCITVDNDSSQDYLSWLRTAVQQENTQPAAKPQDEPEQSSNPFRNVQTASRGKVATVTWAQNVEADSGASIPQRASTPPGRTTRPNDPASASKSSPFKLHAGAALVNSQVISRAGARTVAPSSKISLPIHGGRPGPSKSKHVDTHEREAVQLMIISSYGLNISQYSIVSPMKSANFWRLGIMFETPWQSSAERQFAKRTFLVIKVLKDQNVCLTCHTFGNKGAIGKNAENYLIMHSTDASPDLVAGEGLAILDRPRIKVHMDGGRGHLQPTMRLDLGKMYMIDHVIPMRKLGNTSFRSARRARQYALQKQGLAPDADDDDDDGENDEEMDPFFEDSDKDKKGTDLGKLRAKAKRSRKKIEKKRSRQQLR